MKIKISRADLTMLEFVKDKMLMRHGYLYVIKDFTVINNKIPRKTFWGKHKPLEDRFYLTEITILCIHPRANFLGSLSAKDAEYFLLSEDLYELHNNWNIFKVNLGKFNHKIIKL